MSDLPESDTPANLRPDLTQYGIQEVDRGICLDTVENRKILRHNKLMWVDLYDADGLPTNTIEVRTRDMEEQRRLTQLSDRSAILVNPKDPNSDYLIGQDLLWEPESRELVAAWVLQSTRAYLEREARKAEGKTSQRPTTYVAPPGRCRVIKSDGIRCLMWHGGRVADDEMCRLHLVSMNNGATAHHIEKAKARVQNMAGHAVNTLEELLDSATSEPVRLNAAKEILDRAGVRGGVEVDHKVELDVKPAGELIRERLQILQKGRQQIGEMLAQSAEPDEDSSPSEVILDAEVVDDDER